MSLYNPLSVSADVHLYTLKKVRYEGHDVPIILQNENGPCPLIAICNILLLQRKIFIHPDFSVVSLQQLLEFVSNYMFTLLPKVSDELRPNFEQNLSDVLHVMPNLAVGLDVNVRFGGIDQFEFTSECLVFDVMGIRLVHGWLVDPQEPVADVILPNDLSYNQLVDRVVTAQSYRGTDQKSQNEIRLISQFLEKASHQLTFYGLLKLHELADGTFCVFFRNNHFSTLLKHKGELYLLATDLGFLKEEKIVWEKLVEIDGDSVYVSSDFTIYDPASAHPPTVQSSKLTDDELEALKAAGVSKEELEHNDFLYAKRLSEGLIDDNDGVDPRLTMLESDMELARKLQQELDGT